MIIGQIPIHNIGRIIRAPKTKDNSPRPFEETPVTQIITVETLTHTETMILKTLIHIEITAHIIIEHHETIATTGKSIVNKIRELGCRRW